MSVSTAVVNLHFTTAVQARLINIDTMPQPQPPKKDQGEDYRKVVDFNQPETNLSGAIQPGAGIGSATGKPAWLAGAIIGFMYAGLGLLFVPIIESNCFTKTAGWLLRAIVHEAGHTLMALSLGRPALPSISLGGHVPFTLIADRQILWVCFLVWAALIYLAVQSWRHHFLRFTSTAAAFIYPVLAFMPKASQLAICLSGHGAELLFAGICLWRAQTGLFTHNQLERALYAVVGWYLVFNNFFMCLSILRNPASRAAYIAGANPGIVNDYVVAAYDALSLTTITPVVTGMLIASILVYPVALLYARGAHED